MNAPWFPRLHGGVRTVHRVDPLGMVGAGDAPHAGDVGGEDGVAPPGSPLWNGEPGGATPSSPPTSPACGASPAPTIPNGSTRCTVRTPPWRRGNHGAFIGGVCHGHFLPRLVVSDCSGTGAGCSSRWDAGVVDEARPARRGPRAGSSHVEGCRRGSRAPSRA